jgi:hypothetical protein
MTGKVTSEAFSFKGWTFKEWLKGNVKTIKELFKVGVPFVIGLITTHNPAWTAVITALGKLVLDSVEYFLSEYTTQAK